MLERLSKPENAMMTVVSATNIYLADEWAVEWFCCRVWTPVGLRQKSLKYSGRGPLAGLGVVN